MSGMFSAYNRVPDPQIMKHWSVEVCYDGNKWFICDATEIEGKLKGMIRALSGDEAARRPMDKRVNLGKHSIEKGQLMDVVADLDQDEDYHPISNNCQHWVHKLLTALGVPYSHALTPTNAAAALVEVASKSLGLK
uniref:Uncharacterized protein n=1 Tax=Ixodes ricinus TaxID=34613 RepID=A0A6B0UTL9_IXORI